MKLVTLLLSIAALAFSGCATLPSHTEQLAQAEAMGYGAELPADYQEVIRDSMLQVLKDGYSAQYQFEAPYKGWITGKAPSGLPGVEVAGWIVPAAVNAKNSYGAYVGFKPYKFLIRDGRVIYRMEPGGLWLRVAK